MNKTIILFILTYLILGTLLSQKPYLGDAENYSLFTSDGAFSSTGDSHVYGSVGTDGGEFNAFPPGTLTGDIQVSNSYSAQVALVIEAAYSEISSINCNQVIGVTMGNNQVLTPDVYCIGAATELAGNLILDGLGNPDAIFIIKIDGALNIAEFSNVILVNSASKENVFWQINGMFALYPNSMFEGTAIVNGAITLYGSSVLNGRALSRGGAISISSNLIDMKLSSLPIELISFTAILSGEMVKINWATASEINNDFFSVQHSINGTSFNEIKRIAGSGNSITIKNYSFRDNSPSIGVSYYRIKQTDYDGNSTFSNTAVVNRKKILTTSIYPNPYHDFTTISIDEFWDFKNHEIRIYNIPGEIVFQVRLVRPITRIQTSYFQPGMYFYKIFINSKEVSNGKLIYE